jgi:AcrR family transcriptional regulator
VKRRTVHKLDVRSALLQKATELIARRGIDGISLQDVAGAVGVSRQSLLYYFDTKEALKLAVIDHVMESANKSLNALLAALPGQGSSRIGAILRHVNRFLEEEPHAAAVYLRFLLDQDRTAIARIRAGARPWFGFLEDALRVAQHGGGVRKDLDPEVAMLQVGMLVITNFALMPLSWTDHSSPAWKKRRLREMVRAIELILFAK